MLAEPQHKQPEEPQRNQPATNYAQPEGPNPHYINCEVYAIFKAATVQVMTPEQVDVHISHST